MYCAIEIVHQHFSQAKETGMKRYLINILQYTYIASIPKELLW